MMNLSTIAPDPKISQLIERGLRLQAVFVKGTGIVSALAGIAMGIVGIVAPGDDPDPTGFIAAMIIAGLMTAGGVGIWISTNLRMSRTRRMVLEQPEIIASMQPITIRRRGAVVLYAVHIRDTAGKLVGISVPSLEDAQDFIRRLDDYRQAMIAHRQSAHGYR